MQILHWLLFFFFSNLCHSFTVIHTKYFPTFFARKPYSYQLNMGCDYYIDKELQVYYHNETIFSYIILEREKGYYMFGSTFDEDEDGYELQVAQYIKHELEPRMKPILIYENHTFQKESFERKYTQMIERDLHSSNKTWSNVDKILKIENRHER